MASAGMNPYHQQWVPTPATTVVVPVPAPVEPPVRPADEVRTIFITGLPDDVKERELHNLLRWLPGFEASQINFKADQPMGFALFSTAQHAIAAREALQGLIFDPEAKSALHTEMAKKNLFIKRGVASELSSVDQSKRPRIGGDFTHAVYATPPFHPPAAPVWGAAGYIAPHPPAPYDLYGGYPVPQPAMSAPSPTPASNRYAPVKNAKDNPPCNTLFIGNLGENINEEEVTGLFSVQPGFKQMKILRQERNTVCFIEFEDVNSAKNVHQNLQGAVLASSCRGGMRIQTLLDDGRIHPMALPPYLLELLPLSSDQKEFIVALFVQSRMFWNKKGWHHGIGKAASNFLS